MKKIILIAALTFLYISPSFALGPYVEIFGGLNDEDKASFSSSSGNSENSFDNGYIYGLAAGMELGIIRVEGELYRKTNDFKHASGDAEHTTLMGNAYFDFGLPVVPVTPYIGLGLGYTTVDVNTSDVNDSDQVAAYQILLGAELSVPGLPFDITADYRYIDSLEDAGLKDSSGSTVNVDTQGQALTVGMKFGF